MQEKANTIIQAILVISSIFILVASFVVAYLLYFNKKKAKLIAEKDSLQKDFQQQLLQSQVEVQESTYSSLSKELHDNIGQLLSSGKMLLGLTELKLENPPDALITANATIGQAITEIRSLSKSLDKEWLEQFNFIDNLKTEINRINTGGKIFATLNFNGYIQLNADSQVMLFRIVQEAIQNAIKHAKPKHIDISIIEKEILLFITIIDDGKGFIPGKSVAGMGLNNMNHRTNLLKGTIKWDSDPENGTTVNISIPINHDKI